MHADRDGLNGDGGDRDERVAGALNGGAEIVGAVTGGVVGAVGGPAGAAAGGALGVVLTRALKAAVSRGLASREDRRAGAAAILIEREIQARENRGQERRQDGFFDAEGALRPEAETLLEGILRAAQAAFDERKVALLAAFYTAVAFDKRVAPGQAHFLLRTIEDLTFAQIVAMSVIAHHEDHLRDLLRAGRSHTMMSGPDLRDPDPTIELELADLAARGLVGLHETGRIVAIGSTWGGARSAAEAGYGKLRLLPAGERLVTLLEIDHWITNDDRDQWIERLRGLPVAP